MNATIINFGPARFNGNIISNAVPYGRFQKPLEPLYNPAQTNKRTLWFHHHHGVIPSGGATPPRAAPPGSPPLNDEVYQIGFGFGVKYGPIRTI